VIFNNETNAILERFDEGQQRWVRVAASLDCMADLTLALQPASIRLLTPGFRSSEWNFAKEVIVGQILSASFAIRGLAAPHYPSKASQS